MRIARNQTRGTLLGERIRHAATFLTRARGLLFVSRLEEGEGLLLEPCASIHTLGMRFAIDVAFLDEEGRILRCVASVPPNRLAIGADRAKWVLELPAGTLSR